MNLTKYVMFGKSDFKLWLVAYSYSLFCAVTLQKVILPLIPSLHAGSGLLVGDAIVFHQFAVDWAEQIQQEGWGVWSLFSATTTSGNVSLLAAFYAVFGPYPISFIPLSAAFHALGSVLVYAVYCRLTNYKFRATGVVAGLTFLLFPTSMVWYAQNHKDTFLIVGYLLTLIGFLDIWRGTSRVHIMRALLALLIGMLLVAWMRPFMLQVYFLSLLIPSVCLSLLCLFKVIESPWHSGSRIFIGLLVVGLLSKLLFVPSPYTDLTRFDRPIVLNGQEWAWTPTPGVPVTFDSKLEVMSKLRAHFLMSGIEGGAGSIEDSNQAPTNAIELLAYLPRAALIGVLGPFPNFWTETASAPRVVAAAETFIFYLLLPGLVFLLFRHGSPAIWVVLFSALIVITLQSYVSPNLGTLHRIRYGQWMIIAAMGFAGYARFFSSYFFRAGETSGQSSLKLGALVTGLTTVGVLVLLVRDLILVNRLGFSKDLDFYYLVLLVPMLLVNALCVPLADPFTAEFVKRDSNESRQRLFNHLLLFTGLVLCSLAVLVAAGWLIAFKSIAGSEFSMGQLRSVLFATALLGLSGLTLTGNSLMNASGAALRSSLFQLLVPTTVMLALVSNNSVPVQVELALGGMLLGQLLNIFAIGFYLRQLGYRFQLGSFHQLSLEKRLIKNSIWVMLCALLIGLAAPMNLWFVHSFGDGVVSTWSLATKLTQISIGIGSVVLSTVFVPYVTRIFVQSDYDQVERGMKICMAIGVFGGLLGIALVFVFADPLLRAAIPNQYGTDLYSNLLLTVQLGALQLPFISVYLLLSKMNTVRDTPKLAAYSALAGLILNMVLNWDLGQRFGFDGIAYAWAIGCISATLGLLVFSYRGSDDLSRGSLP